MTDIHWKNADDGFCLVCKTNLDVGYYICNKCKKICQIVHTEYSKDISDYKSVCCNSDVEIHSKMTCSKNCQEKFILKMIEKFGLFKKVVDIESDIAYKVPTRLIIEEGLRQEDLKNYPIW